MFNICFLQKEILIRSKELDFFENLSIQPYIASSVVFTDKYTVNINNPVLHSYYIKHLFSPKIIFVGDKKNNSYDMYKPYGKLLAMKDIVDIKNIEDFLRSEYYEYII